MRAGRQLAVTGRRDTGRTVAAKAMTGRAHSVYGTVALSSSGETIVDISFPVEFVERPVVSFGAALQEDSKVILGMFPQVNAVVMEWVVNDTGAERKYYRGAKLGIRAVGGTDQSFYLDFRFEGTAMVNPTSGVEDDELDDEI